jgi:hypothetical protein
MEVGMNWRHYESWQTGKTCVIEGKYSYTCPFEIGQITTGKQRVFHGYFVRIRLHDGTLVVDRRAKGTPLAG